MVFCGYPDILFTMTGPHVLAPIQVLVPVVLPSQFASTPAAATPASVCFLTQHDRLTEVVHKTQLCCYCAYYCRVFVPR